jgi:hypothetical protein
MFNYVITFSKSFYHTYYVYVLLREDGSYEQNKLKAGLSFCIVFAFLYVAEKFTYSQFNRSDRCLNVIWSKILSNAICIPVWKTENRSVESVSLTTWHHLSAQVSTNFADKRRLGRYSLLPRTKPMEFSFLPMQLVFATVLSRSTIHIFHNNFRLSASLNIAVIMQVTSFVYVVSNSMSQKEFWHSLFYVHWLGWYAAQLQKLAHRAVLKLLAHTITSG